jgi:hypothetical protein
MDDVRRRAGAPTLREPPRPVVAGRLVRLGPRAFAGHAFDPRDPARKLVVELLVDGIAVAAARADLYDPDLARDGMGDGCHAFAFTLDDVAVEPGSMITARLANLDLAVGDPVRGTDFAEAPAHRPGSVRMADSLRVTGWVAPRDGDAWVAIHVDGLAIAEARADGWTRPEPPADPSAAVPTFDLHLPERFADGCPHRLVARNAAGEELIGSPLAFAVAATASPATGGEAWREHDSPAPLDGEIAVVLVGDGAIDETLASLDAQDHGRWIAAALPGSGPAFDRDTARAFLEGDAAASTAVVFSRAGVRLRADALSRLAAALARPGARAVHAIHEDVVADGDAPALFALPADRARVAVAAGAVDLDRLFRAPVAGLPGTAIIAVPPSLIDLPSSRQARSKR